MNHARRLLVPVLAVALAGCAPGETQVPTSEPSSPAVAQASPGETATATPVSPSAPRSAPPSAPSSSPSGRPSVAPSPSPPAEARPLGELGPLDPAAFSSVVDNQWYPLLPGTTWTMRGVKNRKRAEDVFKVQPATEDVAGVACVILQDDLTLNGVPIERTTGYFAQHSDGSVWFFGEDVRELDGKGHVVGLDGSWRAGLDGAVPGLMMPADPQPGDTFTQKTAHANFAVLAVGKPLKVPAGTFPQTVLIEESDPQEPGIKAHKYYGPGTGELRDVSVGGPLEELSLAQYRRP